MSAVLAAGLLGWALTLIVTLRIGRAWGRAETVIEHAPTCAHAEVNEP